MMRWLLARLTEAYERRGGASWERAEEFTSVLAVLAAEHAEHAEAAETDGHAEISLSTLSRTFALDPTDVDLLWSAAAPDVDVNVGLAYAVLRGVDGVARPSVGLALELAGVPTLSPEGFRRLAATGPLRRHALVGVAGAGPWLTRELRVPDPVVAALLGAHDVDPAVSAISTTLVPADVPEAGRVARAVAAGVPLVWITEARGAAGAAIAAGVLDRAGRPYLAVDLAAAPGATASLAAACRAAAMAGRTLVVTGADALADAPPRAFDALAHARIPVVAVASRPWNPAWPGHVPLMVDAPPLTVETRRNLWREHVAGAGTAGTARTAGAPALDRATLQTLAALHFSPRRIAETVRYAGVLDAAGGTTDAAGGADGTSTATTDTSTLLEAARRIGRPSTARSSKVTVTADPGDGPRFADLVLPGHVLAPLRRLVGWGRHRDEISAHGALRRRGRGISAMFAGSPGTGKTLAAHVVAEELSMGLFQVELSTVVDKYIGETEKNLEEVFLEAESANVVLFFDEADAIFGARSAVRDAHDRYANQEIAYLLQRMERFEGIVLLATNLRGNLDQAFTRRMSFVITFPDPDPATRRGLWAYHLAQLPERDATDPTDPIDIAYLADTLELTGGDIRNIVLAAAYDALTAGEPVGMRHIVAAAESEYTKAGKIIPARGLARVSR